MNPKRSSRRAFFTGLASAGVTGALAGRVRSAAAEPPPETSRLRLLKTGSLCWAPQYVAETILRDEGFADITYPTLPGGSISEMLASGQADLSMNFIGPNLIRVDLGDPVVFLAGAHVGCFEVFATDRVRKIRDLKGKTAAVSSLKGAEHVFFSSIAAHVGLDPRKDITWLTHPGEESMRLLAEGKVDAFLV